MSSPVTPKKQCVIQCIAHMLTLYAFHPFQIIEYVTHCYKHRESVGIQFFLLFTKGEGSVGLHAICPIIES